MWQEPIDKNDEIWHENKNGGGLQKFPGLKVRIAQGLIEMIKQNLLEYGQDYLNVNYRLNKAHREFNFHMFPIRVHGMYGNVTHDPIQLDMSRARLDFTRMASDLENVVFIELPLIKYFKIAFDYEYRSYLLHGKGRFDFTMN
jgi:hypothetical protein